MKRQLLQRSQGTDEHEMTSFLPGFLEEAGIELRIIAARLDF